MNTQHFDYLDGWRGLAIIFLLVGHFYPVPGINLGSFGVTLFFVLSGLLMSNLLFIKKVPISQFYQRRISRIFPAFFVMITMIIIIFLLSGKPVQWSEVAMAALFINNYFPGELAPTVMPFGHIWSLSVEEHAYVLLTLIAALSVRYKFKPIHAICALTLISASLCVVYWLYFSGPHDYALWLHTEVSAYGIGISAFFLLLLKDRKIPTLPIFVYPILLMTGLALHWWSVPTPIRIIFGVGILALLVNILNNAPPLLKAVLSASWLKKIGLWSFSIYLWQQPFYLAQYRENLSSSIALSLALLTGITSYYLIEKPARKFLNTRWERRKYPILMPISR
jgi:peptidoglycan/LPS O-acetylase OafA/YrhL